MTLIEPFRAARTAEAGAEVELKAMGLHVLVES